MNTSSASVYIQGVWETWTEMEKNFFCIMMKKEFFCGVITCGV